MRLDASEPKLIERFLRMREEKHNYHIVRSAEEAKIALSDSQSYLASLDYIEAAQEGPLLVFPRAVIYAPI